VSLFLIYWRGHCPTFAAGDSPQHALSAITWGVSWPPSYPLYVALGHVFSKLPGSATGNVSLLSGLLHALAAAVFYLTLRRMSLKPPAALLAVASMALSPLYWYYSEVSEVRALNDFLALAAAYFAVAWTQERSTRYLYLLAVAIGLGVSHHPTFCLVIPALAAWILAQRALPTGRQTAAFVVVAFAACALPYAELGLRLRYGQPAYNLTGAATFLDALNLFLRKDLGGPFRVVAGNGLFPDGFDTPNFIRHVGWFARTAANELTPAGLLLAAAGIGWGLRRQPKALLLWLTWLSIPALTFIVLGSQQFKLHDLDFAYAIAVRFYLLPFISLFALVGFGSDLLFDFVKPALRWAIVAAVVVLSVSLRPIDLSSKNFVMDYMRAMIRSTDQADIMILDNDASMFAMLYLDIVEHATGERVFLMPSLFSFPPYQQWLSRRYPGLRLPPLPLMRSPTEWARLNPDRGLYVEAEWIDSPMMECPATPAGAMIQLHCSTTAQSPVVIGPDERTSRFLDSQALAAATRKTVYPFSVDVFVLKRYRMLLERLLASRPPEAMRLKIAQALRSLERE
jgi:hypothetical protein